MTDYWLSKLFFDLNNPVAAAEYRAERDEVLARYPLDAQVKSAILESNVPFLAQRTNPYLLRYFFSAAGMKDEDFIRRLCNG